MAVTVLDLIEYIQKSPNGTLKTQPGLLDKMQLFLSSKSQTNSDYAELLKYMVELDGGVYVDARKQPTYTSNLIYDREFLKEKTPVVKIDNVTDLSLERAMKLKRDSEKSGQQVIIKIDSEGNHPTQNVAYRLDKYIAVMQRYNEILKGIDFHLPEKEKFALIYSRVANAVEYDYAAGHPESQDEKLYTLAKHNTISNNDALIQGKGLDLATGVVINQASKLTGIKSMMVNGFKYSVKSKRELELENGSSEFEVVQDVDENSSLVRSNHTWNKVKVEGTWYNVFVLADKLNLAKRQMPSMAFLSDKTYKRMGYVEHNETGSVEPCNTDMPEYEMRELFPRTKRFSHRDLQFDEHVVNYLTGEKVKNIQNEMSFTQFKDNVVAFGLAIKKMVGKIKGVKVPKLDVSMPKLPAPKGKPEEITDYHFEQRDEHIKPVRNPEFASLDRFNQTMRTVTDFQLKTMGIEKKDPNSSLLEGLGGERIREENKVSWDQYGRPSIGLKPIREMSESNPDIPEDDEPEKKHYKVVKKHSKDKNDQSR